MRRVIRMRPLLAAALSLSALGAQAAGCSGDHGAGTATAQFSDEEWRTVKSLSGLGAAPKDPTNEVADDPRAQALGQRFFFDARFSGPLVSPENAPAAQAGGNGAVGDVGKVSCARCHDPAASFADQRSSPANTSLGAGWTGRNSQTCLNAAFNEFQFWDGRTDSLWSQALRPLESNVEHNFNRTALARLVFDKYRADFEALFGPLPPLDDPARFPAIPNPPAFPTQGRPGDAAGDTTPGVLDTYDGMTAGDQLLVDQVFARWGKAIAAYERLLVSRDSLFDRFVRGEDDAIPVAAKRGLKSFIGHALCIDCHTGPNFTDNRFHNVGLAQAGDHVSFTDEGRRAGIPTLLGDRFNGVGPHSADPVAGARKLAGLTVQPQDLGAFKTPTLRSISRTAPYFHTGSKRTLREAVSHYDQGGDASGFLGLKEAAVTPLALTDEEVDDLVELLKTLDGAGLPAPLLFSPTLPP